MLTLYAFVSLLHRDRLSANSLAFACIVMLIANPSTLWDVSFQLSFLAVLSIIIFYPHCFRFTKALRVGHVYFALYGELSAFP